MTTGSDQPDLWTRSEPRRRQPRFSREQIAAAALRIADAEGFEALSMRRLARELDASTMAPYHYVRTKDELVALLANAVIGEALVPDDELPSDWRHALVLLARRLRDAMRRHDWFLDQVAARAPSYGPNGVHHVDQALRTMAPLNLPIEDRLDLIETIWDYVFGFCYTERHPPALLSPGMERYVREHAGEGELPQLTAVFACHDAATLTAARHDPDQRFERNLARLLDGVNAPPHRGTLSR